MMKGQRMKRIPPAREYALMAFNDQQEVIRQVRAILQAYAETERGNA